MQLAGPKIAGCGAQKPRSPFGCGMLYIDGTQVTADTTRWAAHEAGRVSARLPGSGVVVRTATRMPFEQNGVIWELNISNPTAAAAKLRLDIALPTAVSSYPTIGTWVYDAANAAGKMNYTVVDGGVSACGVGGKGRAACGRWAFLGPNKPDAVSNHPPTPPPDPPARCSIAGKWIQKQSVHRETLASFYCLFSKCIPAF